MPDTLKIYTVIGQRDGEEDCPVWTRHVSATGPEFAWVTARRQADEGYEWGSERIAVYEGELEDLFDVAHAESLGIV